MTKMLPKTRSRERRSFASSNRFLLLIAVGGMCFESQTKTFLSAAEMAVVHDSAEVNIVSLSSSSSLSSLTSESCTETETCEACNSFHTCHWCAHDSACHAIGSYYGCAFGSTCDSQKKKKNARNETDPTGCLAHASCTECTLLSSHLCHWCAHDNSCHAVGSVYGCVTGVDCYDNTHCKRLKPEPISPERVVVDVPKIPLWCASVIGVISSMIVCCATCCCCIASGIKGAYDDLLLLNGPQPLHNDNDDAELVAEDFANDAGVATNEGNHDEIATNGSIPAAAVNMEEECATVMEEAANGEPNADSLDDTVNAQPRLAAAAAPVTSTANDPLANFDDDLNFIGVVDSEDNGFTTFLLGSTTAVAATATGSRPKRQYWTWTPSQSRRPQQRQHHYPVHRRPPRRNAMHRLYNACVCTYILTVAMVLLCSMAAIYYFPKKPIYNICNDSVAWQSLMDSMTSMKATAEFEILASIYNPNPLDVSLDMGKGSFSHNGALVGTYEIPSVTVAGMAVTDMLIVASFSPEKWQALSIAAEYYRGTLVLSVDAEASIRIPVLADYIFPFSMSGLVVHVNDMSDRSLCFCPTWSDASNKTKPTTMSFLPEFPHVMEPSE